MSSSYTPEPTRFDVDQFHRMGEAGIFDPHARIELIDGALLNMAPIGARHAYAVSELTRLFLDAAASDAIHVSSQTPVILSRFNEPQPDVLVLRGPKRRYRDTLPRAADVVVAVEVSDSTLVFDRTRKLPLYGRNGIAETWLLDLRAGVLEVYRGPHDLGYSTSELLEPGVLASTGGAPSLSIRWWEALGDERA